MDDEQSHLKMDDENEGTPMTKQNPPYDLED